MAIYHLNAKLISRSAGRSATGAAAYRAGECITDERTGLVFDYGKKSGIDHAEIMAPANAPDWVHDRSKLWNEAEKSEKRKDSQVAREVEVALPVELTPDQQRNLIRSFAKSQFVDAGMVADITIHHATSSNPHAHILLTTRTIDRDGFGQKNRAWNDKDALVTWRKTWEQRANHELENAGHASRIDHRSLAAQGIDRIPQIHIGPKVLEMEARGIKTEIGKQALAIETKNEAIAALKSELEATANERNHETAASAQRGADRAGTGTAGAELGDAGRPDASPHRGAGDRQPAASPRMGRTTDPRSPVAGCGRAGDSASCNRPDEYVRASETGAERADLDHAHDGAAFGPLRGGAGDRIRALAGTSASATGALGREEGSRAPARGDDRNAAPPVAPDRSYLAARRQLDAMGAERFEVGVRDRAGRMLIRTWSKAATLQAMPWLKRENAKGADVYVRPAGGERNTGLVLVDDLNRGQLAQMQTAGFAPASITETSPGNFQAWVRVHGTPLPPDVATEAAAMLAERFGGDPNSADWRHFGRLAGLTNAKPEHRDAAGRSPYVLAHASSGQLAPAGPQLVAQAEQRIAEREAAAARKRRQEAAQNVREAPDWDDPIQTYRYGLKALYARFGADMDMSRADYILGVNLASRGFSPEQIGQTIEQASPELPTRKAGHQSDYVNRTVKAVFENPKVREELAERAKSRTRDCDRGMSM